jgi:GNAT superfamily N-acetyltransferase
LLGYHQEEAVGWCAVAPRADYPALGRSRVLKPVDDQPCWSVVCLFIRKDYRRQGVSTALLKAAADYVREQGERFWKVIPSSRRKATFQLRSPGRESRVPLSVPAFARSPASHLPDPSWWLQLTD